jgi:tetraspanin-33
MGIAVVGFVFPQAMQTVLEESFTDKIIHSYREDPDLQNLIDFGQKEVHLSYILHFLYTFYYSKHLLCIDFFQFKCCGLSHGGYTDWAKNEYFNCSSPSVESCGVPYSCCINATDISVSLASIFISQAAIIICSICFRVVS